MKGLTVSIHRDDSVRSRLPCKLLHHLESNHSRNGLSGWDNDHYKQDKDAIIAKNLEGECEGGPGRRCEEKVVELEVASTSVNATTLDEKEEKEDKLGKYGVFAELPWSFAGVGLFWYPYEDHQQRVLWFGRVDQSRDTPMGLVREGNGVLVRANSHYIIGRWRNDVQDGLQVFINGNNNKRSRAYFREGRKVRIPRKRLKQLKLHETCLKPQSSQKKDIFACTSPSYSDTLTRSPAEGVPAEPMGTADMLFYLQENCQWCDVVFLVGDESSAANTTMLASTVASPTQSVTAGECVSNSLLRSSSPPNFAPTVRLPAHRLVLAAASPVFEAMLYPNQHTFSGGLPEPTSSTPLEVHIRGVDPRTFLAFLGCIYTDKLMVDPANIIELVDLGHRYQIPKIRVICGGFLEQDLKIHTVLKLYEVSPVLLGAQNFGLQFISHYADELIQRPEFLDLSVDRLQTLLRCDDLETDELNVFLNVVRWGDRQALLRGISRQEALAPVMPLLRLPTLSLKDLALHVQPTGLLTEDELCLCYRYAAMTDGDREVLGSLELPFCKVRRKGGLKCANSLLLERKHFRDVLRLLPPNKGAELELLYRGSEHGFTADAFHRRCGQQGPTLTFIRPVGNNNLFGGYFGGSSWNGGMGTYSSAASFIFSLVNQHGAIVKLLPSTSSSNVYLANTYGPTWGGGHDLHVNQNMTTVQNYTNPCTYTRHDPAFSLLPFTKELFAGSYKFAVAEIEVFWVRF